LNNIRFLSVVSVILLLSGCSFGEPDALHSINEVPVPAHDQSGQPNLSPGPKGDVYLSWLEHEISTVDGATTLKFAKKTAGGWSEPRTIVSVPGKRLDSLLVNWADFPSLLELPDGSLTAHWSSLIPNSEGYNVQLAISKDAGKTWSAPVQPHRDTTETEHGFVSMTPVSNGVGVIWLDSRRLEAGSDDVALMYTRVGLDGSLTDELDIDDRVCECCQPSSIAIPGGVLAVYRDRTNDEIRDIAITRFDGKKWSAPRTVFEDRWQITACPIQGPAISAGRDRVAIAWFTAANDKPRVQLVISGDLGETFGKPIQIDTGNPMGRVDVVALDAGGAVVTWIEKTAKGGEVRARQVESNGKLHDPITIAKTSIGNASGFPRVERSGDSIVFTWTDTEDNRVRTAVATP
jgi:hypothetical protein